MPCCVASHIPASAVPRSGPPPWSGLLPWSGPLSWKGPIPWSGPLPWSGTLSLRSFLPWRSPIFLEQSPPLDESPSSQPWDPIPAPPLLQRSLALWSCDQMSPAVGGPTPGSCDPVSPAVGGPTPGSKESCLRKLLSYERRS
eukprot:359978-Chlamydomonas_euryale.AAC.4